MCMCGELTNESDAQATYYQQMYTNTCALVDLNRLGLMYVRIYITTATTNDTIMYDRIVRIRCTNTKASNLNVFHEITVTFFFFFSTLMQSVNGIGSTCKLMGRIKCTVFLICY